MAQQTIKLTWDQFTNDVTSQPETVDLIAEDVLVFSSDQGPVNLKFDPPENFGMVQVVNGTLHVQVLKRAAARITCGVVIEGVTHGFPAEDVKTGVNTIPGQGRSDGGDGSGMP
jgi:hypothetical protein